MVRIREILFGLTAILVLWGAIIGWQAWEHRQNRKAADRFEEILASYPGDQSLDPDLDDINEDEPNASGQEGQDPLNITRSPSEKWKDFAQELRTFIKDNGGTSLVSPAHLYLGKALLQMSAFEESLTAFRTAQKELNSTHKYLAKEGEGMALTELGKWKDAEIVFRDLSQDENNPLQDQHAWYLGMALERADQKAQAIEAYKQFEQDFASSPLLERVKLRLLYLEQGS